MINWEEIKHIHVIRKLEEILAHWFNTDIFVVDEKGAIRDYDGGNFRNPLVKTLWNKERARQRMAEAFVDGSRKLMTGTLNHRVVQGPAGVDSILISRIMFEGEYLGCVVAYCFLEEDLTAESQTKALTLLESLGFDRAECQTALSHMKVIAAGQKKYFFELVDLVAQEIVTFHSEISKREERIQDLNQQLETRVRYDSMIGKSKPMQELYGLLDKIKSSESTILIQGENGTGKELIARAVHFNSPRKDAQFLTVNCSAFNENLLDSELFGHVKGAFTGAVKDKKGLFEAADHGTLFLDEIGDMPLSMQVKLLRVLQQGTLMPVGGTEQRKVDVRVLAATNKDIKEMVEEGQFREDLYYRINVINLVVPPLRERKDDIPILVDHFMEKGCKEKNVPEKQLTKKTLERIFDYPWPGNIRELENEVERLIVLAGTDEKIQPEMLSQRIRDFIDRSKVQGARLGGKLKGSLEELEKTMIREGLRRTNWNKSKLAKELGISRAGLIHKVEKYQLDKRKIPRNPGGSSEAA